MSSLACGNELHGATWVDFSHVAIKVARHFEEYHASLKLQHKQDVSV